MYLLGGQNIGSGNLFFRGATIGMLYVVSFSTSLHRRPRGEEGVGTRLIQYMLLLLNLSPLQW